MTLTLINCGALHITEAGFRGGGSTLVGGECRPGGSRPLGSSKRVARLFCSWGHACLIA
jgi:hypothetical protein